MNINIFYFINQFTIENMQYNFKLIIHILHVYFIKFIHFIQQECFINIMLHLVLVFL